MRSPAIFSYEAGKPPILNPSFDRDLQRTCHFDLQLHLDVKSTCISE